MKQIYFIRLLFLFIVVLSPAQYSSPDSDGDGIVDFEDLDDDNDGILDIIECPKNFLANNTSTTWKGLTSTTVSYTGFPAAQAVVSSVSDKQVTYNIGQSGADNRVTSSSNVNMTITFASPVPASEIAIMINDVNANNASPNATYTIKVNGTTPNSAFGRVLLGRNQGLVSYNTATGEAEFSTGGTTASDLYIRGLTKDLMVSNINITSKGISAVTTRDVVAYSIFALATACDIDGDGVPNDLDTDSDGDGCPDAVEEADNVNIAHLAAADITTPFVAKKWSIIAKADGTISTSGTDIVSKITAANGVPEIVNTPVNNTSGIQGVAQIDTNLVGQGVNNANNASVNDRCFCTLANSSSATELDTKVGISALSRLTSESSENWPKSRKGGHIALESESKGFTITRMTTSELSAIKNPVVGMLVYDTVENCLKAYVETSTSPTVVREWKCMNKTGCPSGATYNK
ncbi:thrombospondin [Riemerella anatipestifer]|nr:thrombospondin [Riemerella anatipestifer]